MSHDDDFKAGLKGETFQFGMNQISYEAGAAKRKDSEAQPSLPKTEVSGVGLTMLMAAPLLVIMYPVAGLITIIAGSIAILATIPIPQSWVGLRFLIVFVVVIMTLVKALKAEHAVSRSKVYRIFRHIFRLGMFGAGTVAALFKTNAANTSAQAFNEEAGPAIFFGFVVIGLMAWIFPKLDRVFFPVMDDKAKAEVKRFAGKSEDEVWTVKNLEWRNKKRFFLIWLIPSAALMFLLPKAPFVLILLGVYLVCLALKGTFQIRQ